MAAAIVKFELSCARKSAVVFVKWHLKITLVVVPENGLESSSKEPIDVKLAVQNIRRRAAVLGLPFAFETVFRSRPNRSRDRCRPCPIHPSLRGAPRSHNGSVISFLPASDCYAHYLPLWASYREVAPSHARHSRPNSPACSMQSGPGFSLWLALCCLPLAPVFTRGQP